jgi:hypothetical protein
VGAKVLSHCPAWCVSTHYAINWTNNFEHNPPTKRSKAEKYAANALHHKEQELAQHCPPCPDSSHHKQKEQPEQQPIEYQSVPHRGRTITEIHRRVANFTVNC